MARLTFYMKSGNVIVQRGVKDWEVKSQGDGVTYIRVIYRKGLLAPKQKMVVAAMDLTQIEAIVSG